MTSRNIRHLPHRQLSNDEPTNFSGWLDGVRNFVTFTKLSLELNLSEATCTVIKNKRSDRVPVCLIEAVAKRHDVSVDTVLSTEYSGRIPPSHGRKSETKSSNQQPVTSRSASISELTEYLLTSATPQSVVKYLEHLAELQRTDPDFYAALVRWLSSGCDLRTLATVAKAIASVKENKEAADGT